MVKIQDGDRNVNPSISASIFVHISLLLNSAVIDISKICSALCSILFDKCKCGHIQDGDQDGCLTLNKSQMS